MKTPMYKFNSKYDEIIDRLKVFALDTLTYDLRRFVYRLTFKEIFRYIVAGMFLVLIPTLVVLAILSSVYTGYLFINSTGDYVLWLALSVTGFLTAYLFYYFSGQFLFNRSSRLTKLPDVTNPAEVFISRVLAQLREEQRQMVQDYHHRH